MKLNIGSGYTKLEGFTTIDYDQKANPDYCLDLEKDKLPFEDNTVEVVVAHHILEHLGDGYFHLLQELYRVCKHNAVIDIRVPHPRHDAFLADPTHKRPITPMGLRMFNQKFNQFCIEQEFPTSTLGMYFDVDFDIIEWSYIPEHRYKEFFADKTKEFIDEYINERNNVISEYHIKLAVIKNGDE